MTRVRSLSRLTPLALTLLAAACSDSSGTASFEFTGEPSSLTVFDTATPEWQHGEWSSLRF